jgi:hypothetical protein
MSKILKKLRNGMFLLSEGSSSVGYFGKIRKTYYSKRIPEPSFPKNPKESLKQDMKKIGSDMYSSIDKLNVQ